MKSGIATGILLFILAYPAQSIAVDRPDRAPVYLYNLSMRAFYPSDYHVRAADSRSFSDEHLRITLYAREFSQGNAVYVKIVERSAATGRRVKVQHLNFQGRDVPLTVRAGGFSGLFAVPPCMKPGLKRIVVSYYRGFRKYRKVYFLKISATRFHVYPRPLDLGKYSDVDYQKRPEVRAYIKECSRKKKAAFMKNSPDMFGPVRAHPRNMHYITSPFWAQRVLVRFVRRRGRRVRLKNGVRVHRGLDLRGEKGAPVFAIAGGRVALAEKMFYEGNFIILDHGNRVFSYYMHLSGLSVSKGDRVYAGKRIGSVGSTGVSTSAHLHLSLMIRGVQVDPLSILPLPMR